MTNIELIMNPSIAPVYINASNAVLPIMTITLGEFFVCIFNAVNDALMLIREVITALTIILTYGYENIAMIISTLFYKLAEITGYSQYTVRMVSVFACIIVYLCLKHCVDYDMIKDNNEEFNTLETKLSLLGISHRVLENKNKTLEQKIEALENNIKDYKLKQIKRFNNIDTKIRKLDQEF